jgi:hypothetical protein
MSALGGKRTFFGYSFRMNADSPSDLRTRFKWAWKIARAGSFERKREFERALRDLDGAANIWPLRASDRVHRARLLLRNQRIQEGHRAFATLREEFKGSDDPGIRYLRHYCTYQLSSLTGSAQWSYEAKQAKLIDCSRSLKRRFPMTTVDEIHERIRPRR